MNYYEHHLGDWAAATGHLTWDEDMAYTRLLRSYYHAEKAIPDGQQYRLAKASTPAQRKAVDAVITEFFVIESGAFHQKRADQEIERYQDKQRKAKASANARWSHTDRNANASPDAMRTHSEGNALQTPDTIPITDAIASAAAKTPRASRKCPKSFDPTEPEAWTAEHTPGIDWRRETEKFRDHTFKNAMSDWDGCWRNWMRNAKPATGPRSTETSFTRDRKAQASAWMGSAAPQSGEVIDMEQSNVTRLALG